MVKALRRAEPKGPSAYKCCAKIFQNSCGSPVPPCTRHRLNPPTQQVLRLLFVGQLLAAPASTATSRWTIWSARLAAHHSPLREDLLVLQLGRHCCDPRCMRQPAVSMVLTQLGQLLVALRAPLRKRRGRLMSETPGRGPRPIQLVLLGCRNEKHQNEMGFRGLPCS